MATNKIPERLIAFRVYADGSTDLKGLADINLPQFASMVDTVSGAGIAGEYESPTIGHFQSMKIMFNWRTPTKEFLRMLRQQSQRLDCRGAFQNYDAGTGTHQTSSMRVVVQGMPTNVNPGNFATGAGSDASSEFEVMYIKIEIDGRTIVEYDKLNYIFVVDGVDYLAAVRATLGI